MLGSEPGKGSVGSGKSSPKPTLRNAPTRPRVKNVHPPFSKSTTSAAAGRAQKRVHPTSRSPTSAESRFRLSVLATRAPSEMGPRELVLNSSSRDMALPAERHAGVDVVHGKLVRLDHAGIEVDDFAAVRVERFGTVGIQPIVRVARSVPTHHETEVVETEHQVVRDAVEDAR